jgi:16S rRNA processing protein RimM
MIPAGQEDERSPVGDAEDLISIARIARPHGLHGEVIADILTDFPERFEDLEEVLLRLPSGEVRSQGVERTRPHKDRVILKFRGFDRIEQTDLLRGASVLITRSELVPLPADSYYDFDLVDCEVLTCQGETVGYVTGVEHYGAAPLLVVVAADRREFLIPLAATICIEVDTIRKRIVVDPPEGLLD